MQQFVFHRIVGMELDRFILQGDNNGWLDSYRPTSNEIVGKLLLHIPKFGKAIEWVRAPTHAATTAGLFGVLLMLDMFKKTPQTKREGGSPSIRAGASSQLPLASFALLTVLFLVLGIYSFTRPVDLPAENVPYQQTGDYFYSATGTPGVYDSDVVQTGEPVFPKLTCFLNVGFTYAITGDRLQNVTGTQSMYARIMDEQSGWQRTIPLYPDTPFSGATNFTMATLNLCEVESIVNLVEAQAGLKQISYTLEIVNEVKLTASVDGAVFSDTFSPSLAFHYDKIHFFLAEDAGVDPLHSVQSGMVGSAAVQANSTSMFGFAVPVWMLRFAAVFGLIISAIGLSIAGMGLYRTASETEEGMIRLKYGGILVNVHEQNLEPYSTAVDVNTMDDLARLADRHGVMILHMKRNFLHYYFVQSNGATYRYVITAGKKGVAAVDEPEGMHREVIETPALDPLFARAPVEPVTEPEPVKEKRTKRRVYELLPRKEITRNVSTHRVEPARETVRQAPAEEEAVSYVIDTGEIDFYVPQREDAVIIERVRF
ncbi:MAG: hypothetical protein HYU84_15580, partial [Chloroflexi bacterium]|nr:hypothetical protein [Chloroflexota bacterium]